MRDDEDDLQLRLRELTKQTKDTGTPEEQGEVFHLVARARAELANEAKAVVETRELQKRLNQPFWMGRHFEVIIGVLIAAAVIFGFVVQSLLPLVNLNGQIALQEAKIAANQAKIQQQDTVLTMRENERVRGLLAQREQDIERVRNELTVLSQDFERRLAEQQTNAESEIAKLNVRLSEAYKQGSVEADRLRSELERVERDLEETQTARTEITRQTERLEGTWRDEATGLLWQTERVSEGGAEARSYCDDLVLAGVEDWRLPTESELRDLTSRPRAAACGETQSGEETCKFPFKGSANCNWYRSDSTDEPAGVFCESGNVYLGEHVIGDTNCVSKFKKSS